MRPPPEIAEIVLGQPMRTDSHLVRLVESLPFPFRGWLPVPFHGEGNTQLLDPWPWLQMLLGAVIAGLIVVEHALIVAWVVTWRGRASAQEHSR